MSMNTYRPGKSDFERRIFRHVQPSISIKDPKTQFTTRKSIVPLFRSIKKFYYKTRTSPRVLREILKIYQYRKFSNKNKLRLNMIKIKATGIICTIPPFSKYLFSWRCMHNPIGYDQLSDYTSWFLLVCTNKFLIF